MNIFNSLARPWKLGRLGGNRDMSKLQKCLFAENISLYIRTERTGVHLYTYLHSDTFYTCYIRRDGGADRSSALIDNLVLVERRAAEGREETRGEREREHSRHFVSCIYIYFRMISRAIIFTFFIRETSRCLTDRNISFAKVCA